MQELNCIVNGKNISIMIDPSHTLADVLRVDLALTGTKKGCEEGECGACTILIDGGSSKLMPYSGDEGSRQKYPHY